MEWGLPIRNAGQATLDGIHTHPSRGVLIKPRSPKAAFGPVTDVIRACFVPDKLNSVCQRLKPTNLERRATVIRHSEHQAKVKRTMSIGRNAIR